MSLASKEKSQLEEKVAKNEAEREENECRMQTLKEELRLLMQVQT